MLLVEKYCRVTNIKTNFPICDKKGFIAYSFCDEITEAKTFSFIFYTWDIGKSHPGYYTFKYYDVSDKDKNNVSYLIKNIQYVTWCDFFKEIAKIKNNLVVKKDVKVANSEEEADLLLWRSFMKTQDNTISSWYRSMPDCMYDSIDETINITNQSKAKEKFLQFVKNNFYVIYNSWNYFLDTNVQGFYCNWFYKYAIEKD